MKKTVKLSVLDRLIIPQLLPKQGRIIEMTITQSIVEYVQFSPKEISEFGLKDTGKGTEWNQNSAREIDVELTKEQAELLLKGITTKDDNGEVTLEMVPTVGKLKRCLS